MKINTSLKLLATVKFVNHKKNKCRYEQLLHTPMPLKLDVTIGSERRIRQSRFEVTAPDSGGVCFLIDIKMKSHKKK